MFLKEAELSNNGTKVTIRCVFADDYPEASCVLIYRKYNETPLTVVEYNHTTSFPVSETVECSDSERCTYSLFGKNGDDGIDREPVIRINGDTTKPYQQLSGNIISVHNSSCECMLMHTCLTLLVSLLLL